MRWLKHKHLRSLARRFWGTVILLVLVLAVVVQLGREAFPMLNDYREAIARHASQTLGVQVEIGAIDAAWVGLRPRLNFRHVIMRTTQGRQILTAGESEGELDLLQSVREWQLVWRELKFDQLRMQFQQERDGRWTLGGFDLARTGEDEDVAIQDPLDIFLLTRHLTVNESTFQFVFRTGQRANLSVPRLMIENDTDFHRLTANFAVDGDEEAFSVVIEGQGNPRDEEDFAIDGYVALENFPMEKAVAALDIAAWDAASEGAWSEGHRLDGRFWFQGSPYSRMELKGRVRADGLPLTMPGQVQMPASLRAEITGRWRVEEGWHLALQGAEFAWEQFAAPPSNMVLSGGFERPLRLQVDQLDIEPWLVLAQQAGLIEGQAEEIVAALAPRGQLSNLLVERREVPEAGVIVKANLHNLSANAYRGAPAVESLDGYLEASPFAGRVVIDSRNGFSMHYPQIYDQPLNYSQARGEVRWAVRQDIKRVDVTSGRLSLSGEDGEGRGYFQLQLPYGGAGDEPHMTLLVGLENSHTSFRSKYVPRKIPPALYQWLEGSIRDGSITRAGFLWHGSLAPDPAAPPSIQLFGRVEDGQLQFQPDWPALRQVQGSLVLDNRLLDVNIRQANLSGNRVEDATIRLRPAADDKPGQLLLIDGEAKGDLADALRLVRNSPLADILGPKLTNWRGAGQVRADVDLAIPLGGDGLDAQQKVTVQMADGRLALTDLRLMLDQVNGSFRYDSRSGLTADKMVYTLWGREGSLSIASHLSEAGLQRVQVNAQGSAPAEELADWLRRPELNRVASGVADFELALHIPLAGEAEQRPPEVQLELATDLAGFAIDLPAPYGKTEAQTRPLNLYATLADEQHYRLSYDDDLRLQFILGDALQSLSVALGEQFYPLTTGYMDVTGKLGEVNLATWQQRWQSSAEGDGPALTAAAAADLPLVPRFNLQLDALQLEQLTLEHLALSGERQNSRWRARVISPHLTGELFYYDDGRPLQVSLESLHFPAEDARAAGGSDTGWRTEGIAEDSLTAAADPVSLLKTIQLDRLPAVDVSVASLTSATRDYGAWSFELRPVQGGVMLRNLRGRIMGLDFAGPATNGEGGELLWLQSGAHNSTYLRGVVSSANLGDLLHQVGQAELLESEFAQFEFELLWPGAPDEPKLQQVEGTLAVDIRRGRFIRGAEAGNNPFLRLFGLLNFDTLVRRLKLDFSDLYQEGMVFDSVTGEMRFAQGQLLVEEALRVESPSSTLQFAGILDADSEQIDATLVATLPVTGNLAVAAAFVGGLPAALGVYAVGKLFKEQVNKASSIRYRISGAWEEPNIRVDRIFASSTDRAAQAVVPGTAEGESETQRAVLPLRPHPLGGEPEGEARVPPRNN